MRSMRPGNYYTIALQQINFLWTTFFGYHDRVTLLVDKELSIVSVFLEL